MEETGPLADLAPEERMRRARQRAAEFGRPRPPEYYLPHLLGDLSALRAAAAAALESRGVHSALFPNLLRMLKEGNADERLRATEALTAFSRDILDDAVRQALRSLVETDPDYRVRHRATLVLEYEAQLLARERILEQLQELMQSGRAREQSGAERALRYLGEELNYREAERLEKWLQGRSLSWGLRLRMLRAFGPNARQLETRALALLTSKLSRLGSSAGDLAELDEASASSLYAYLLERLSGEPERYSESWTTEESALAALAEYRWADASYTLTEWLDHPVSRVRKMAAAALRHLPVQAINDRLLDTLERLGFPAWDGEPEGQDEDALRREAQYTLAALLEKSPRRERLLHLVHSLPAAKFVGRTRDKLLRILRFSEVRRPESPPAAEGNDPKN